VPSSRGTDQAESEARERRAARWSWTLIAIVVGVPVLLLVMTQVYLFVVVDTTTGMTVGESLRTLLWGIPVALLLGWIWTRWGSR